MFKYILLPDGRSCGHTIENSYDIEAFGYDGKYLGRFIKASNITTDHYGQLVQQGDATGFLIMAYYANK